MCDFVDAVWSASKSTDTRCEFGYAEGKSICAILISDTSWCSFDSQDATLHIRLNAWFEWYNPTNTNED